MSRRKRVGLATALMSCALILGIISEIQDPKPMRLLFCLLAAFSIFFNLLSLWKDPN